MKATELITLFELAKGQEGTVSTSALAGSGDAADRELALRLFEIGFVDGERVRVIARGYPGGDPLAVRVGGTMFALRRFEAERVLVAPLAGGKQVAA
ncbi:FeoA family protein [Candidatus Accumulibacter sp. ACC003]|uniref:FeoA family protein n=1 Tax=Candidatus Accumulibacter sp. ACC003 TaxID=2823334 RepID=UPI0025C384E7|nr:FeoA family protein [Candidatus Accumulibacter sp. ACC003]